MKYLKRFEKILFDANDVEVDDYIEYRQNRYTFFAKVIQNHGDVVYTVQNDKHKVTIAKEQILRYLTKSEIEEFEISLSANKYNL